jgi:hypothetical protein
VLRWESLGYHVVRDGHIEGSSADEIAEYGVDFEGPPDEVVFPQQADTDFGIGYHAGRPCLFGTEDGGYGYYVPEGTVYEQRYGGFAYRVVAEEE